MTIGKQHYKEINLTIFHRMNGMENNRSLDDYNPGKELLDIIDKESRIGNE